MTDPVEAAILRSIEVCPYKHSDCINQSLYPCIACQWGVLSLELRHTNKDSFISGAQWQAKQSPWISVEERLPSSDNDLYIALNTKMTPPGIDVCEFDVKSKRWTDSRHVVVRPTHWMPIPKLS